jgi:hypothetical protein
MAYLSPQRKLLKSAPSPFASGARPRGRTDKGFAMVGIFRRIWTLWLQLHSGLGSGPRSGLRCSVGQMPTPSRSSVSPVAGAAQVSDSSATETCHPADALPYAAPAKLFYSLMVEVRPEEADAQTLQLFSDEACFSLSDALSLPAGCKLRRCMYVSAEFAQMLIRM